MGGNKKEMKYMFGELLTSNSQQGVIWNRWWPLAASMEETETEWNWIPARQAGGDGIANLWGVVDRVTAILLPYLYGSCLMRYAYENKQSQTKPGQDKGRRRSVAIAELITSTLRLTELKGYSAESSREKKLHKQNQAEKDNKKKKG